MRKTRFFIMAFLLVGIMFVLSGCAYYSDSFDFEFNGEYMSDKYVDLLIPLEETDEFYTDYNCNIEGDIEIPETSEIVNYNKDGFRSMLMHIKEADLHISKDDSENKIIQRLGVPYYEGRYSNSYNEEMFLEFCNKYKKCRVAVFDRDGNILQISKKIKFVSLGNFYLQDISYDVENNVITPHYIMSKEILDFVNIVWSFSLIGTIGCIITLIVYKINHSHWYRTYKGYIIASFLFNVPNAILIILDLYCNLVLSFSKADFFINSIKALFSNINMFVLFLEMGTIAFICPFINIGVLVFFIFKQKHLKKGQ